MRTDSRKRLLDLLTADVHIARFGLRIRHGQRRGRVLKHGGLCRLRIQADVVLILQQTGVAILRGLQIQAVVILAKRHDLRAELIAGVFAGHQIRRLLAGLGDGFPVVPVNLKILPDNLIVLAEHRHFGVQRFQADDLVGLDLERVGVARDHGVGNGRPGRAVACIDVQLARCVVRKHPADCLREDADVHFVGLCAVGIAFISFGFEDSVVILVLRVGLVFADQYAKLRGHAVDRGRADHLAGLARSGSLVELDCALGGNVQLRLQGDRFALILDDARFASCVSHIRNRQRYCGFGSLPHGVQRRVFCEFRNRAIGRLDRSNIITVIRSRGFAVDAPAEERIAGANRSLVDNLVVVRCAFQIVLHGLRVGHSGDIIAGVRVVGDGHGLARNAGHVNRAVLLRLELVGIDVAVDLRRGKHHAVDANLHRRCVEPLVNRDRKGHLGAVGHLIAACERARCRCVLLRAFHFDGVAVGCRRYRPSDLRGDGIELGVDRRVCLNGIRRIILCGASLFQGIHEVPRRCVVRSLVPTLELVPLDHRVDRAGRLFVVANLLRLIDAAVGQERHGVDRVGSNVNIDRNILRDPIQPIVIFLRSVLIGSWLSIAQRIPGIDATGVQPDLRRIFRVSAVDNQVEFERISVRNGHGSVSVVERITLAAAERDGVGLLLPHGVEGDVLIHGIHITGLIAGGGGACRRTPAEEDVALAGGNFHAQRHRKTVGLGLIGDGSGICGVAVAVQLIRDGIGRGRQLGIDHGICRNVCQRGWRYTVLTGIPAVEAIPFDFRFVHRTVTAVLNILHVVGTVVYDVSDLVEPNRFHIDGHGFVFLNIVQHIRIRRLDLLTVHIHAIDGIAVSCLHGKRRVFAIRHRGALTANRSRR